MPATARPRQGDAMGQRRGDAGFRWRSRRVPASRDTRISWCRMFILCCGFRTIRYRRERWVARRNGWNGDCAVATWCTTGHFGPELHRFVLAQYHQGQVTVPRLVDQLRAIGVAISKRQVMRLLIAGQDDFLAEAQDVLRAGSCGPPAGSPWTIPAHGIRPAMASAGRSARSRLRGAARPTVRGD